MTNAPTTPAGWYPDPAGSPRSRWWDGTQWTENFHDPLKASQLNTNLTAPEGTSTTTLWYWGLVVITLISILQTLTVFLPGNFEALLEESISDDAPLFSATDLVSNAISFILVAAFVLFSYFDFKALRDNGLPRPFHWAWSFFGILFLPLYLFGRAIVVNRRTGSGLSALWVPIVYFVVGAIVFFIAIGIGIQAAMDDPTLGL